MKPTTLLNHSTLCPLPWNGIFVDPRGEVKNCAISQTVLGNINDNALGEVVNNDVNKTIRQDMLDQNRHSRCNACYKVEDNSPFKNDNESNRSWYKKIAIKTTDLSLFDHTENFSPTVVDLRWRNTCNYACVYCGSDLSSTWESMVKFEVPVNEDKLERSKQYIFDNLQSIKHVYLAGGEPLLMKSNQDLLERLYVIDPTVEIRINSNVSNLNTPVFDLLKKFKNVRWTISVDSTDKIFEYIRWPGDWQLFLQNIQEIKRIWGDQINFNMVWCILNHDNIFETFDCLLDQGFHENMFVVQCLTEPRPLNLLHLPPDEIERLKAETQRRMQQANPSWWLYKSLGSMYNFLQKQAPNDNKNWLLENTSVGITGTFEFLAEVDRLRGISSRTEIFKNLYQTYDSI